LGGHFKTLFDWKFDKTRVLKDRGFRKNLKHPEIIEKELFNYELFGDSSDILDLVIPPRTSLYSRKIYDILTQHIVLVRGEMGVGFRESRHGLSSILKSYGIDYRVAKPFVDDLEYRLMTQYNKDMAKK